MKKLIERLERAEAGSRELDQAIAEDVLGLITEWMFGGDSDPQKRLFILPLAKVGMTELPHYTTSLDAALTLRPIIDAPRTPAKSWPATVDIRCHDDGSGTVSVRTCDMTVDEADDQLWVEARAATPALALCIACLRARTEGRAG